MIKEILDILGCQHGDVSLKVLLIVHLRLSLIKIFKLSRHVGLSWKNQIPMHSLVFLIGFV